MKLQTIICHEPWHVFLGVPLDGDLHNSALVSKLWVYTLRTCSVSQNLILFASGFPDFRVWVWSRGPHLVCKEYFASFTWESIRWVLRKPTTQTETQPCCPLRTLSPCISWVRCLGKGRACFSAQFPHLVSWPPLLLLERSFRNGLGVTLSGMAPEGFIKEFSLSFLAPCGMSFALGREKKTHPSNLSHGPGGTQVWLPTVVRVPRQERWWCSQAHHWGPPSLRSAGSSCSTCQATVAPIVLACPWCVLKNAGEGASLVLSASGSCVHISFCPSLSLCPSSSIQSRHLAPAQGFPIPREASLCPISHPDCSRLLPPFRLSDPDVPVLNAIPFESCWVQIWKCGLMGDP